jgi:hypothetical protein
MKPRKLLGALLTAGLALAVMAPAADVLARKKDDSALADPPLTKKAVGFTLTGIAWGQSPKQVADQIDRILDQDYAPLYREVQPGIKMRELDGQIAEDKSQFRRSRIDFGKLPTGLDGTPLRLEYTYNNKEALMSFARTKGDASVTLTYFFFIQERLWKVIEERKLNDASPFGKSYPEAVVKMSTTYGVPGRVQQPDGTNRLAVEVDWKDATTHLRAIQRGDTTIALAYEDNGTLASLASLRPNKLVVDNGIDPDVAAAMRGPSQDPGPPDPKKKK